MHEIWKQVGAVPIINASGHVTRLGGARLSDAVQAAWRAGAASAAALDQVQAAACRHIAHHCGTEAGLVTNGAAAGLCLATAAVLAGNVLGRMERLPDTRDMPAEILVARSHRSGYDHAVRAAGAQLIEVGYDEPAAGAGVRGPEVWEFAAAVGPRTAGVLYTYRDSAQPSLVDVVQLAHAHRLPVIVDAAAELPPVSNLGAIPATGADLVVFSGGKALGGPQDTGILCGRRALVGSAFLQMMDLDEPFELWAPPEEFVDKRELPGLPRHGIGRMMKVAKEDIFALLVALEEFVARHRAAERASFADSHVADAARHRQWLDRLAAAAGHAEVIIERSDGHRPRLVMVLPPGRVATDVCRRLRAETPAIYLGTSELHRNALVIHASSLTPDDVDVLEARLKSLDSR